MKTRLTILSLTFAASAFMLISCGEKKQTSDDHGDHANSETSAPVEEASKPQFEVDQQFQSQLAAVFTSYVELKDAFVSSDAAKVKTALPEVQQALDNVDMKLTTGAAHNDWTNYQSSMKKSLGEMEASSDIEAQRKSFSVLSDNLYKSIKAFGLGGDEAFYEFCPMAFDNEGGYWLSDVDQIRNPYFGDKMLSCGEVVEKLQ